MAKKKKKERTTKRLRREQQIEKGLSRAAHRVANAVSIGVETWRDRRDPSTRPGDTFVNVWKSSLFATGRAAREMSWAPSDFYVTVDRRLDPRRILARAMLPFWT
jgi:hypothetical protein